jgi:hypothetical protein
MSDEGQRARGTEGQEVSADFEQALARAMRPVEVRAETTAKFLALADEAERQRSAAGGGPELVKLPGGGRVLAFPKMKFWTAWAAGAVAAVIVLGVVQGDRIEQQHERRVKAQQEFETAQRITDQTLQRTREQLQRAGISLDED